MRKSVILALALLFLNLHSASAQWNGSAYLDGSWNFLQSNRENANFKLNYKGQKFHIGSDIYFGHSYLPSSKETSILDAKKEMDEYYKGELKTIDPRKIRSGVGLDFGYIFNPNNSLDVSVAYGFNETGESSLQQTERISSANRSDLEGTQIDTTFSQNQSFSASIAFIHDFESRPDAHLGISFWGITTFDLDINRRITSGNFYSKHNNYATYSSINDLDTKFSAFYNDVFHIGNSDLKLKAGLDFFSDYDLDGYNAETYVNGVWRDSTAYKQSYLYASQTAEPYVNLTFTAGKFDFSVKERIQFYWHMLMDKLEDRVTSKNEEWLFNKFDIRNLLIAGITYRINDNHRISLNFGNAISRPDYAKLCPTLMIGKSEGEYIMGNPDLLPEMSDKIDLGYTYTKGIFVTSLDLGYHDKRNTAEKVIDLEKSRDISDPGVKTLYSWINNKRQQSFGSKLDLIINGKDVKAEMWAGLNYDIYWKSGTQDKADFNYELGTSINVYLNENTKLSSDLAYISAKRSAYNLNGENVIANLRFSKILIKGLELYAELKNIVDKEVYEETWNADMNYLKVINTIPNLRAAVLGVQYVF